MPGHRADDLVRGDLFASVGCVGGLITTQILLTLKAENKTYTRPHAHNDKSSVFFFDITAANLGDASSSSDMEDDALRDSWVENFAKGAAGIPKNFLWDIVTEG